MVQPRGLRPFFGVSPAVEYWGLDFWTDDGQRCEFMGKGMVHIESPSLVLAKTRPGFVSV
jgi:hypothetical protein